MPGDFPIRDWYDFGETLWERRYIFYDQIPPASNRDQHHHFVMPCGLLLVIDKDNGGDITAEELVKRFHLLDQESRDIIDFYFLGWKWVGSWRREGIRFDLAAFESCRKTLRDAGVDHFGGNADLILVDAHYRFKQRADNGGITDPSIVLDFKSAIYVNLASRRVADEIPPLGEFLQSVISAAEEVRQAILVAPERGSVALISDRLGLAVAKKSLLQFIYKKWGAIIGAGRLDALAVRNLGPQLPIKNLPLKALSAAER